MCTFGAGQRIRLCARIRAGNRWKKNARGRACKSGSVEGHFTSGDRDERGVVMVVVVVVMVGGSGGGCSLSSRLLMAPHYLKAPF